MALSLGVKRGSQITLTPLVKGADARQHTLTVKDILDAQNLVVEVDGAEHRVSDLERVEVIPNCFIYSGAHNGRGDAEYTYLAFEAPRNILIDRVRGHAASQRKDR